VSGKPPRRPGGRPARTQRVAKGVAGLDGDFTALVKAPMTSALG
jgi:hypothetical protein